MRNNVFSFSSGYRMFCWPWWKHWFDWATYYYPFKYSYQRITRGWADKDVWSVDSHLSEIIPEMLERLKKTKHGVPSQFFPEDMVEEDGYTATKEAWEIATRDFDETLDKIILGFNSYRSVNEHGHPKEFVIELETSTGWRAQLGVKDRKYDWEKIKAWNADRMKEFEEGMKLLTKHFGSMWD